jgi:hypothetical protein
MEGALGTRTEPGQDPVWKRAAPLIPLLALVGIPGAGFGALVLLPAIPQSLEYRENLWLFAGAIASPIVLIALLLQICLLRSLLKRPSAPSGFYRDVLDFPALARWHPAVKAALVGQIVLPPAWYIRGNLWRLKIPLRTGWQAFRYSSDFLQGLQSIAVSIQLSLLGGVPLLFMLYLLARRKPGRSLLLWLLLPVLFLGTAVAIVFIGVMLHEPG